MKISTFFLAAIGLGLASAPALSFHYPYHAQHQVGETLTVVHTPVPRTAPRAVAARRAKSVSVTLSSGARAKTVSTRKVRKARRAVRTRAVAYRYSGVAGGCRAAGYVRRNTPLGVRVLQREICYDIAPTTLPINAPVFTD